MLLKINATIYANVKIFPPDVLNSDTVGEYKAELDCALQSDALEHIWNMDKPLQEVVINSVEPYDIESITPDLNFEPRETEILDGEGNVLYSTMKP